MKQIFGVLGSVTSVEFTIQKVLLIVWDRALPYLKGSFSWYLNASLETCHWEVLDNF